MSEYVVYRTLGNGRCLVLDGTRIAGGKPDYRGNNYITSWVTNETYGPVDELKSENVKLRELLDYMTPIAWYAASEQERDRMRELGVEVGDAG